MVEEFRSAQEEDLVELGVEAFLFGLEVKVFAVAEDSVSVTQTAADVELEEVVVVGLGWQLKWENSQMRQFVYGIALLSVLQRPSAFVLPLTRGVILSWSSAARIRTEPPGCRLKFIPRHPLEWRDRERISRAVCHDIPCIFARVSDTRTPSISSFQCRDGR